MSTKWYICYYLRCVCVCFSNIYVSVGAGEATGNSWLGLKEMGKSWWTSEVIRACDHWMTFELKSGQSEVPYFLSCPWNVCSIRIVGTIFREAGLKRGVVEIIWIMMNTWLNPSMVSIYIFKILTDGRDLHDLWHLRKAL